ncbi:hypothetical protein CS006_02495 [Bifidobacterium primatium]|uniref:Cell surface protein n=1 Tax=Bifidobacterium primatium TaxID=2045438 RepID=A0A2M9HB44_9BIFI|nr:hypothetical protein CS006_02495 [Bifidobacterium primatium]
MAVATLGFVAVAPGTAFAADGTAGGAGNAAGATAGATIAASGDSSTVGKTNGGSDTTSGLGSGSAAGSGSSSADGRPSGGVSSDDAAAGSGSSNTSGSNADGDGGASREYSTEITFTVNGRHTTVTRTYTGSLDVTVPSDTELDVPEGYVIVGWKSSTGVTYSADLLGAKVSGEKTVTFTAVLAQQLPDLPSTSAQVHVRFVIPNVANAVVSTTVDRGSSYADAYAAVKSQIESRMPANLRITGWHALLHTYKADLSDAGAANVDTTFFAVSDLQATNTQIMFSVGNLFVLERVKTGSSLSEALAAKQGVINALVPAGYSITGWTDELTGKTYDANLSGGVAEGWNMHLVATLKSNGGNGNGGNGGSPSDVIHVTVTFIWKDAAGRTHQKQSTVLKGLWLLSSDIPSPQAPSGMMLDGWYSASGMRFNRFLPVREDATYTARWKKIPSIGGSSGNTPNGAGVSGTGAGSGLTSSGDGSAAANRTAAQQWLANSQGKTPVAEQNRTLATTGTAIAAVALASAALLLAGTCVSMLKASRGSEAGASGVAGASAGEAK